MKKVIFLCLLSLSVCFSKPAEEQAAPAKPTVTNGTDIHTPPVAEKPAAQPEHTETQTQTAAGQKPTEIPNAPQTPQTQGNAAQTVPQTEPTKPSNDNKTTDKKEEAPKAKDEPKEQTTNASNTKATTEKASSEPKPEENKAKNETTTQKPIVTPTTEAPKPTEAPKSDADKHVLQARGFDGPSFIGGIILTLGMLAIGFMGFKYYKNQTERNYHTL